MFFSSKLNTTLPFTSSTVSLAQYKVKSYKIIETICLLVLRFCFACEISAQIKYLLLKTNLLTLFTYLQYKAGGFKLQGTLKVHFSLYALFTLIDRGTLLFSFSNTIKED